MALSRQPSAEHRLAALLLGLVLALFYRDVVFGGRSFLMQNSMPGTMPWSSGGGAYGYPGERNYPRLPAIDRGGIAWVNEPSLYWMPRIFRSGEIPLWDPHTGLGQPHLASGQAGVFEPIQFIFYFICPESLWTYGIDAQLLLRFYLAGLFTYLFLREAGFKFLPALFAGIAFMLSNYLVDFANHPQVRVNTLLPLLLYAYERLFQHPGPGSKSILIAIGAVTWSIIADSPEPAFMALSFSTLWYGYRVVWMAYDAKPLRIAVRNLVIVLLFSAGLASFYILPLIENVSHSYHFHEAGAGLNSYPGFFTSLSLIPGYYFGEVVWAPHYYIVIWILAVAGAICAVASVFGGVVTNENAAVASNRTKACTGEVRHGGPRSIETAWFFLAYFVIFFPKIYGAPWVQWIGYLPFYSQLNLPWYLNPGLELSLTILAAISLESLLEQALSWRQVLTAIGIVAAFLCACVLIFGLGPINTHTFAKQVLKLLAMAVLVAAAVIVKPRTHAASAVLLIVCLCAEAFYFHHAILRPLRFNPYNPPPFVDFLEHRQQTEQPFRIFAQDGIVYPNLAMAYNLDDTRYLVALDDKRRQRYYQTLITPSYKDVRVTGEEAQFKFGKYFDLLNARYFLTTAGQDAIAQGRADKNKFELIYDKEIRIYRNKSAFPRAFVVHAIESAKNTEDALARLARDDFDPAICAVAEGSPDENLMSLPLGNSQQLNANKDPCKIVARSANTLNIETALEKPGILVVSEGFNAGWQVTVDGAPAAVFPVDVLLRGVYLKAGVHQVHFIYSPLSFTWGVWISTLTCFGLLLLSLKQRFLKKR